MQCDNDIIVNPKSKHLATLTWFNWPQYTVFRASSSTLLCVLGWFYSLTIFLYVNHSKIWPKKWPTLTLLWPLLGGDTLFAYQVHICFFLINPRKLKIYSWHLHNYKISLKQIRALKSLDFTWLRGSCSNNVECTYIVFYHFLRLSPKWTIMV